VDIDIKEVPKRRCVYLRDENDKRIILPAFYDKEDITGTIIVNISSKTFQHNGIKIKFTGYIENILSHKKSEFISLSKDLLQPSIIHNQTISLPFSFNNVEKAYESYRGLEFNVKYIISVVIEFSLGRSVWEREIGVSRPSPRDILNINNNPIKLDVGIGQWMNLIFEIKQVKLGTKDVCQGNIIFKRVSLGIKSMLLQIIKRETEIGKEFDQAILCRYEIMDGSPVNNEVIPFRFFLSPFELTPTYENVNNIFSVKYYLNLVIIDQKNERYFKQQEITLFRIPRNFV
jgi:vacuolar protein sorting-associated protein 26